EDVGHDGRCFNRRATAGAGATDAATRPGPGARARGRRPVVENGRFWSAADQRAWSAAASRRATPLAAMRSPGTPLDEGVARQPFPSKKESSMSDVSIRIFESVKGDPAAIQSLATAIGEQDAPRVGAILAARGVELTPSEIASVISSAGGAGAPANFTFTFTMTMT
ncbi:MAG TPA: hypothetical protein VHE35_14930, partial [Kofleriaceae bacterium]|nr:hypothetical protein [Kofleriaceae bacterium]